VSIACELTQRRLPAAIDDDRALGRLQSHLEVCLRCQAEAARYRKIAKHLGALLDVHETAPAGLVVAVGRTISGPISVDHPEFGASAATRAAAVVGAIAAAAGTAVVVKILRTRSAA
jgi:hypothetical protein